MRTLRHFAPLIAASGSAALLLAAFGFQYLGDLPPCQLCIWQRYPHVIAILIGLICLIAPYRLMFWLGAGACLCSAMIGVYHIGVEQLWWQGPTQCSGTGALNADPTELFDQIMSAPIIRCDAVLWSFLGLSMAAWNAVISSALAALWLLGSRPINLRA